MSSPQRTNTRIASIVGALGVGVTLAACGHSEQSKPTASSSAQPQPASSTTTSATPPPSPYDISRVDNVKSDFPEGFNPDARPPKTLNQQDIDSSGVIAFTKAKIDPPQCRALIIPPYADPTVGTQAAGVRGQGDDGQIYVVALRLPKPVPATPLPAGCDKVSMSGAPNASGTAEGVPAPSIDGVTTTGAKMTPNNGEDPDYIFTAALDSTTSIVVMGSTNEDLEPQQSLSDLLVKATAAVRGQ